jgi:hypothetical protein
LSSIISRASLTQSSITHSTSTPINSVIQFKAKFKAQKALEAPLGEMRFKKRTSEAIEEREFKPFSVRCGKTSHATPGERAQCFSPSTHEEFFHQLLAPNIFRLLFEFNSNSLTLNRINA